MPRWLQRLFGPRRTAAAQESSSPVAPTRIGRGSARVRFVVRYERVVSVPGQAEGAAAVGAGGVIAIVSGTTGPKWLMLRCPCGCGQVRRVSVSPTVRPSWTLQMSPGSTASLYPSVWLQQECRAHFILRDNLAYVV